MATQQVIGGRFVDDILNETTSISIFLERLNYLAQKENQEQHDDMQPPPPLQHEKVRLSVYKHGEDKHEDELIANFLAKASLTSARLPPINTNDHHHGDKETFKKSISKVEEPKLSMDDLLPYHLFDDDEILDENQEEKIGNFLCNYGLISSHLRKIDSTREEDDYHEDIDQELSYFSYDKLNKEALKKSISKIEEPKLSKDDQEEKTRGFSYFFYDDVISDEKRSIASMKTNSEIEEIGE